MGNLHLLFHKTYYSKLGCPQEQLNQFMESCNRQLLTATFEECDYIPARVPNTSAFLMQVCYPGLLVGTGYSHGTGISEVDINCGFSLEYVSGQPYIPGSTVKGMLRSNFAHPEVIEELLPQAAGCVKQLERDIFEDSDAAKDIFLDAVVRRGDRNKRMLARDFVTSHMQGATQNPVPVHMIKLAPEVVLEFRFVLSDSVLHAADGSCITVTPAQKLSLFTALLEIFGIGAKTNTGYGILKAVSEEELETEEAPADMLPLKGAPAVGEIYTATVTRFAEKFAVVKIDGSDESFFVHHSKITNKFVAPGKIHHFLTVGQRVRVKYIQSNINGELRGQFSIRDAQPQAEEVRV